MAAKNDQKRKGAEATDVEDADASIVVMVPLPKKTVAWIDARAARRRGGATRVEELQRLLRIGLEAEEKQITS